MGKSFLLRSLMLLCVSCLVQIPWSYADAQRSSTGDGVEYPWIFTVGGTAMLSNTGDAVYSDLWRLPVHGGLALGIAYNTYNVRHGINIRAGGGRVFSPYPVVDSQYPPLDDLSLSLSTHYSSVFAMHNREDQYSRFSLLFGPGLHFYFDAWLPDSADVDILRYTWMSHTGLGMTLRSQWETNRGHGLSIDLYVPVLALGFRPTYSVYTLREETILEEQNILAAIFSNPLFFSYHNFFSMDARLAHTYRLSPRLSFISEYNAVFEYVAIPRERLEIQNNIMLGVTVVF